MYPKSVCLDAKDEVSRHGEVQLFISESKKRNRNWPVTKAFNVSDRRIRIPLRLNCHIY